MHIKDNANVHSDAWCDFEYVKPTPLDSLKFVDHLLLTSKEICEEIAHYKDAVFDSLAYYLTFKGSKVNGFRRAKRQSFVYLKERVWKKLQGWKEKLLS
uniref:Uncharacterized protein n=1 Tax=Quercus lobata TaxID=97700 RepID=A0A7N2RCG6_QUELO